MELPGRTFKYDKFECSKAATKIEKKEGVIGLVQDGQFIASAADEVSQAANMKSLINMCTKFLNKELINCVDLQACQ